MSHPVYRYSSTLEKSHTYVLWSARKQKLVALIVGQLLPFRQVRHRVLLAPTMHDLLRHIGLHVRPDTPGVAKVLALGQSIYRFAHFILSRLVHDRVAISATHQRRASSDLGHVIMTFLCYSRERCLIDDHIVQVSICVHQLLSLPQQTTAMCVHLHVIAVVLQDNLWIIISSPQLAHQFFDVRLLEVQVEDSLRPVPLHVLEVFLQGCRPAVRIVLVNERRPGGLLWTNALSFDVRDLRIVDVYL